MKGLTSFEQIAIDRTRIIRDQLEESKRELAMVKRRQRVLEVRIQDLKSLLTYTKEH